MEKLCLMILSSLPLAPSESAHMHTRMNAYAHTHTLSYFHRPRSLPIAGFDLDNVFLLREPYQANQIAEAAEGKNVVIIGTSFIGQ